METASSKIIVKIVKVTTKNFNYYKHLVGKAVADFEKIDPNFKENSTVGKMLSNSNACYNKKIIIICERKSHSIQQTSLPCFKKLPQPPNPSEPPPWLVSSHQHTDETSLVAQWIKIQESTCRCRGHGFSPGFVKIPQAMEQLSLCTTATEPVFWSRELQLLSPHAEVTEAHTL